MCVDVVMRSDVVICVDVVMCFDTIRIIYVYIYLVVFMVKNFVILTMLFVSVACPFRGEYEALC